jgi:ABC-type multidrug transport system fused ATPase/permease subunit
MLKVANLLMPFFKFHPWSLPLIILLGILASLAEGVGVGLFIPFLETLNQDTSATSDIWLVNALGALFSSVAPDRRLLVISLCIIVSIVVKAVLTFVNKSLLHWLDAQVIHRLRSTIVGQLLHVDYRYIEKAQTGSLINTLGNETWRSSEAIAEYVHFVNKASALAVYVLILLLISWQFTLLVLLVMGLISLILRRITRHAEALGKEATRTSDKAIVGEIEVVAGMKTIRNNNRELYQQEKFEAISKSAAEAIRRVSVTREFATPVYEILAGAFLVALLYLSLGSGQPLAIIFVFLFILYRLQPLVKVLDESRIHIQSLGGAVDAVTNLLNDTKTSASDAGEIVFAGLEKELRFDDVSFRYDCGESPALENISVVLPAGQTIALVGHSGAGKTTFANLIARLYDAERGELRADGVPLQKINLASWRERIAAVSQETYLFNDSVRENIAYGRVGAGFEEIVAAASDAEADSFIRTLPRGYDTILGEAGVRLSGGQKQRIALARALIRKPDILILDEATNALDNISEQAIQNALQRIRVGRTVFIIAHRLTTITHADLIIVLENGRIVEQGTYEHLIQRQGVFAKLYRAELRP